MEITAFSPTPRIQAPAQPAAALEGPRTDPAPLTHIQVQVERLSLDGFNLPPGGDRLVQAAFQGELTRLLSEEQVPALLRSGGARRSLPGEPLNITHWSGPGDLGRQIARAIYEGMRR